MAVVRGQFLGLSIDIEKDFRQAYYCLEDKHSFKTNLAYFIIQDGVVTYPPVCEHCGEMQDC